MNLKFWVVTDLFHLLSTLLKGFEKIILKNIYKVLFDTKLITPFQSSFLPEVSTIIQLVELQYYFTETLNDHQDTRIIVLHISKVFDKVWHDGFLYKLRRSGIKEIF